MTDFQRHYKQKGLGFGNVEQRRIIRAGIQAESRKGKRAEHFAKHRNVSPLCNSQIQNEGTSETEEKKEVNDRMHMLLKWKAERDLRKKIEQMKKKPAFKVGVVHHSLCSPPIKDQDITEIRGKICKVVKSKQASPPKRMTRATEKRLMAKASASGTFTVKNIKSKTNKNTVVPKKEPTLAPENHVFKPPAGIENIPLFGRVVPQNMTPNNSKKFLKSFSFKLSTPGNMEPDKPKIKEEPFYAEDHKVELSAELENEENEPVVEAELGRHNSSIETVHLKLSSSDEQESPVNSSKTRRRSTQGNIQDTSQHDTSLNTTPCPEPASTVEEPVFFSPYIVTSRGKSSARKEQKVKRGLGSPVDAIPTKDTVMQNLNISIEEEERTSQYFKFILNREIERLEELCEKWSQIKLEPDITEDALYSIIQTIGQTELLMRKKFERFRSLVADCETGKGQMLVTCKDLQGFWDMTLMEVKNCDSRFENLEKLRANGWVEDEQPVLRKPVAKKKAPAKKKVVSSKQSSIRALILAARKEKMIKKKSPTEEQTSVEDEDQVPQLQHRGRNSSSKEQSATKNNARRSVSLNTSIQKSTPVKSNNTRHSLLRKVQLSETSKRLKSPLTIIKISQKCKTPEIHLDDTISYVNSDQTPAKSILKKADEPSEKESHTKPANKVNFDEHVELNEVPVDEELQNKLDLQAALARIESYSGDVEEPAAEIRAERRLTFDDDSSDESSTEYPEERHNGIKNNSPPAINILPATPHHLFTGRTHNDINRRSLNASCIKDGMKRNSLETQNQENEPSTRTLRNRTVSTVGTPRRSRRSVKVQSENDKVENTTGSTSTRRKSTRKSVRFNAEDCTACLNSKPVLPMTPHARRSKPLTELSFLGERDVVDTSKFEGDLIAWESPKKLPSRVRRSSKR